MTIDWRLGVTRAGSVARLADVNRFVHAHGLMATSAIDRYYQTSTEILQIATPSFLGQHPASGSLMLIGIVSALENFFRDLFASAIALCPVCQAAASSQSVNLGSVLWQAAAQPLSRAAFEHISFTSAENVKKTCKAFLGSQLRANGPADVALIAYDDVCELRHCIVHAGSILQGKNAINLGVKKRKEPVTVRIGFAELQEAASICTVVASSVNTELFEILAKRWATAWRRLPSWDGNKADELFLRLWKIFFSTTDSSTGQIQYRMGPVRCRNLLKKEHGL